MRRIPVALLITFVALLAPARVDGCTCMPPRAPCEAAFEADAVFVGRVTGIDTRTPARRDGDYDSRAVRLELVEPLRGISGTEAVVTTGSGGGDCGYAFRVGETYLVYAHQAKPGGPLSTGICSRTRPVDEASEDLSYLRGLSSMKPTHARVSGQVFLTRRGADAPDPEPPSVNVTLKNASSEWRTQSDRSGRLEVSVEPGEYEVIVDPPTGYYRFGERHVGVPDIRACASVSVHLGFDGRLSGHVVDEAGKPVPGFTVEAFDVSTSETEMGDLMEATTAADGRFVLSKLAPGRYVVGSGVSELLKWRRMGRRSLWYPGTWNRPDAAVIDVGEGTEATLGALRLPDDLPRFTVQGIVRDEDGRPAVDVEVFASERPHRSSILPRVRTDEDGRFTLTLRPGVDYAIVAEHAEGYGPSQRRWTSDPSPEPVSAARDDLVLMLRRLPASPRP